MIGPEEISPGPWVIDWKPVPGECIHPDYPELHYVTIRMANYNNVGPHGLSVTGYMRLPDVHVLAAARDMLEELNALVSQAADTCGVIEEYVAMPVDSLRDKLPTTVVRLKSRIAIACVAIAKASGQS